MRLVTEIRRIGEDHAELLEKAAEAAHDAWWEAKKAQGFHPPEECPEGETSRVKQPDGRWTSVPRCPQCHKDMRPYADLDEATKELDRAHVRAVHKVYASALEAAEREREREKMRADGLDGALSMTQSYAASIAQGIDHYPHAEGEPCVRCDRDALAAQVGVLREALDEVARCPVVMCGCGEGHKTCDCVGDLVLAALSTPSTAAKEWEGMRAVATAAKHVVRQDREGAYAAIITDSWDVDFPALEEALAALDAIRKEKP